MMNDKASGYISRLYIRFSLLLLVLPILYLALWIFISGKEGLTYFEQVQMLMDYIPESLRSPYGISLTFFGFSLSAAIFGFMGYLKSHSKKAGGISLFISFIASLITIWFGLSLL